MELFEAIKTRRSIRHYKPDAIPEEKINTVLAAARWAPSWNNCQPWRFVLVQDKEQKTRLAKTLAPANRALQAIKEAPMVIVLCAKLGCSGFIGGKSIPDKAELWYMFDVALAMQNLTLMAHSLGLGTVHIGWFNPQEVAQILNIPDGVTVVEMTPLGYPAEKGRAPSRRELAELVFYESYSQGTLNR